MPQIIELGMGLLAAAAAVMSAVEGVRIFATWRRDGTDRSDA
jgi:hypothetical protein